MKGVPSDHDVFLRQCLVFVFFKLKEYQNAKIVSEEMIKKLDKEFLFSISDNEYFVTLTYCSDGGLFIFQYVLALSLFEARQSKEALKHLYRLLREVEANKDRMARKSDRTVKFIKPQSHREHMILDQQENEEEEDEFSQRPIVNEKKIGFSDSKAENDEFLENIKREKETMFGIFPSVSNLDGKYIMISLEILRIHMRNQDYRNAHMTISKLVKVSLSLTL